MTKFRKQKLAKSIMIQGTASHVGKSILVTALCRIFAQDGYRVAPFKSQNMALNSFVTPEGGEIGRAQAAQAEAAGIPPSTLMNPILLKPTSDMGAQVILHGKVLTNMSAAEYHSYKKNLAHEVLKSYQRLSQDFDIIVIEGAGSPVEVNLREHDIVNMGLAELIDTPVILTGDIDRGGVFASLIGTWELLSKTERNRLKAVHINKFRGDIEILRPGLDFLEQRIGRPVLGVTPYIKSIGIQAEDSLSLEKSASRNPGHKSLKIQIPVLPHISNFTDFDVLKLEEDVELSYIHGGEDFDNPDLIILPGTKNTIEDFIYLEKCGLARQIRKCSGAGTFVFGICGGYQMLGREILDPQFTESVTGKSEGLNLLNTVTTFEPAKITSQVKACTLNLPFFSGNVAGYEIHMGRTQIIEREQPVFSIKKDEKFHPDGASRPDFKVMGTYLHGIFDNDDFRHSYLNFIRKERGFEILDKSALSSHEIRQRDYNRLADVVRESLNMDLVYKIINRDI